MKIQDADRSDVWFTFADEDEVNACSHQGDCESGCTDVLAVNRAEMEKITREQAEKLLKPTGAWDEKELKESTIDMLYIRIIWIAASDARENDSLETSMSTY
jgi:hypothetical protein